MRDDVVKFKVGSESREYFVHPGLLLRHSEFFVRALTGNWKEAAEKAIRLDDVDCETCKLSRCKLELPLLTVCAVEIFVEWLYTQRYPTSVKFAQNEPGKAGCALHLGRVKACEFGDRFQAPTFLRLSENALVDCLISGEHAPFYSAVIYAFKNLSSESVVLQAFIDNHCRHWSIRLVICLIRDHFTHDVHQQTPAVQHSPKRGEWRARASR